MKYPQNILGTISHEKFLTEYWQKKPLLIKNAIPNFESPIDADELAGLACEADAHSRLVIEKRPEANKPTDWQVKSGPFEESVLSSLPKENWSLLVQEVDTWVEDVKELRDRFNFIPDWRIDDVMVSFSPDQSSVGPHTDHYDVFLLQGIGRKRWQIGTSPLINPELVKDVDLKLIHDFKSDEEYILEPGDILYLPPEFAHHGIAEGSSMTYSIGFRSPSKMEIASSFIDSQCQQLSEQFYSDSNLQIQNHSSEIQDDAIENVIEILKALPKEPEAIRHWFGQMVTQSKRDEQSQAPSQKYKNFDALLSGFPKNSVLVKNDQLRFAFSDVENKKVLLFIDGGEYILDHSTLQFIQDLCSSKDFAPKEIKALETELKLGSLILTLFNDGHIIFIENE